MQAMAKKQVAVVVSGGASLGAYMAGALDEVIRAFNAVPGQYEIDIIVGTSAGATTGGLLAHELLYRADRPALHQVWVEEVDIRKLLAPDPEPPPGTDPAAVEPPAILNGRYLHELAMSVLGAIPPVAERVRAPCCADPLTFGVT